MRLLRFWGHCSTQVLRHRCAFCRLLQDLVSVVMLSLPCGWLCTLVGLPSMFGYIVCGILLGPSGLNSIKVRSLPCNCCSIIPVYIHCYVFCHVWEGCSFKVSFLKNKKSVCVCPHSQCSPSVSLSLVHGSSRDAGGAGCVLHALYGWS